MSRINLGIAMIWTALALFGSAFGQVVRPNEPNSRPIARPKAAVRTRVAVRPTVAPPVVPSGPLQQVPMSDLPSTPPQVTYQNGMLTIMAQNSSLGDILREIHKRTGATIDVPSTPTERVVTRIGPAPAREALITLLNGAGYNYVMVGTAADPTALANVILTSKPAGGAAAGTVTAAYQPQTPYLTQQQAGMAPGTGPGGPVAQAAPADEEADAAEEKDEDDSGDQEQAQDQTGNGTPAAQDGAVPNGGPKTPEQILEMLRQRQGQQPPVQPPPVPGQPNAQPPENQ